MDNQERRKHIKDVIHKIEEGMVVVEVPLLLEDNTVEGKALIENLKSQKYSVGPTPAALFMCTMAYEACYWSIVKAEFIGRFENDQFMAAVQRSIYAKKEDFEPIRGRTFLMLAFLLELLKWYGYNPLKP